MANFKKKALLLGAVAAMVVPTLAMAANQVPTDITDVIDNPPATYAAGTTLNVIGPTGTATVPDLNPWVIANQGPDYDNADRNSWLELGSWDDNNYHPCGTGVPNCEAKFRSHINSAKVLCIDPIRNFGEKRGSHCHEFFGNLDIDEYSTYQKLRTENHSVAAGGPNNATGYWFAAANRDLGGGLTGAWHSPMLGIYYVEGDSRETKWLIPLFNKLRYVFGTNMDDPDDLARKAEIVSANAQPGTAGRYAYAGDGFAGWRCLDAGSGFTDRGLRMQLKNEDGSDPWSGQCAANSIILLELFAPDCTNGKDFWVPGGYMHMRYKVFDNVAGKKVCPNNWSAIPALEVKVNYHTSGPTDYMNRRLSSDNAAGIAAGRTFPNGRSAHGDWFGGWSRVMRDKWLKNCLNVPGLGSTQAHTCASSIISDTELLLQGASPDGLRNPQVNHTLDFTDANNINKNYRIFSTTPTGNRNFTIK